MKKASSVVIPWLCGKQHWAIIFQLVN